jgi:hypothetical protein
MPASPTYTPTRRLGRLAAACGLLAAARACDPAAPAASCSFGGLCDATHTCACRPEWTGQNCSQLNLGPARLDGLAFSSPGSNVSSWGGSVACVFATNACWMAVAVMAGNCGLDSWEANSEIVLARSPAVDGRYEPVQTLLAPFAHNPTMHVLPNRSIVIAHIGQGEPFHPYDANCTNGSTPVARRRASGRVRGDPGLDLARGGLALGVPGTALPPPNFLVLESGMPGDGSAWRAVNSSGGAWAANNPALHIDPADGSVLLVYKVSCACPPPACSFCRQFGVATAPSWDGEYTDRGLIPVYGEDAYVWRDPAGAPGGGFHILFQGGSYAPIYPSYLGHWHTAFSPDGVTGWAVERFSMAFNGSIALQSGGSLELARRERHQVVFDSSTGAPAFLFNGAMALGEAADHTFTTVQPILH